MIAIVHDIVRAILVLVLLSACGQMIAEHKATYSMQPVYGSQPRPIQRVGRAGIEMAESILGVFR